MQSLKDFLQHESVGVETCAHCGNIYKLFNTPHGPMGACKPCEDKKFIKSLNLPTTTQYRQQKEQLFIQSFERASTDLQDVTVNSYKPNHETQKQAKQMIVDFITKFDGTQSIVLAGSPGIGKSHLAYATNKAIRKMGYKTLFIKSTELLDAIKRTYDYKSNITDEQIFRMIDKLDLLVLDDLGGEYEKKNEGETWASDILFKVVDMRLGKSLITTTNYNESGLIKKYGQVQGSRIVSRVMENAKSLRMEGTDQRRERF